MKLFVAIGLLFANPLTTITPSTVAMDKEIPAYAKWSRLALKETTKKYPNAKIIDYLYMGTVPQDDKMIATFQLWLKENSKEFGVRVKVTYDTVSQQYVNVEFEEFARPV
ncbi:DUF3889 domain-containing protein [Sporosarcina oncorhynchi]|uniref:DUF3889 domain-containing protein n=1 Tax=Sporosarcina oncorhynchi TaxID=3056444 RepID=A0ABZ0LAR2_9BACL|nr:DUF3889 domain-containing protein [Sporosarcina sp. T2O-4]WOV89279.1 DUF3889 domain-containing protein [Sporosarcina sp. T2O-4]